MKASPDKPTSYPSRIARPPKEHGHGRSAKRSTGVGMVLQERYCMLPYNFGIRSDPLEINQPPGSAATFRYFLECLRRVDAASRLRLPSLNKIYAVTYARCFHHMTACLERAMQLPFEKLPWGAQDGLCQLTHLYNEACNPPPFERPFVWLLGTTLCLVVHLLVVHCGLLTMLLL